MSNYETHICLEYADAVFQRATRPMEPKHFSPDWEDQPSRYKIYRQVERIRLFSRLPGGLAPMADIIDRMHSPSPVARTLTFEELSTLLLFAHGILRRRLAITWNLDHRNRTRYHQTTYGRGTASGGGMYPTEIYWACGPSGPLLPGLYHYDNAHHAMERLYVGDLTGKVREALLEHPAAQVTDQFLMITLNFWKNAFKYNSFCYHVVTQDLGALLGSLRFVAAGLGSDLQFLLWYHDEELNKMLGIETLAESVFAAIPLPADLHVSSYSEVPLHAFPPSGALLIDKESFQRSKAIIRFPLLESVHQSALVEKEPRPGASQASRAGCNRLETLGERIELPAPAVELLQCDLSEAFQKRRSSFGRFSRHRPLSLAELATLLYFGSTARNYTTDLKGADGTPYFTRLMVFVNNVQGVDCGAYAYDWKEHCLWTVCRGNLTSFLQQHYFLQNYNLVETGAVIAIVGRVEAMLEVYGNRGYRVLNMEVGLVAQSIYLAASALSFGCGAALGFDNVALNKVLGLENSDQKTLLFLLTGHERQGNADFDSRIF